MAGYLLWVPTRLGGQSGRRSYELLSGSANQRELTQQVAGFA